MIKKLLLISIYFISIFTLNAQEISGKIFDLKTLKPLENVAISVSSNIGTVSDKYGSYTLNLNGLTLITFSSLGYEDQVFDIVKLKKVGFVIYLKQVVNALSEVKIHTKKIPLDSILSRTKKYMKENYLRMPKKEYFNAIKETKLNLRKYSLDLKKNNSLSRKQKKLAKQEFELYSKSLKDKNPTEVSEFNARASSYKRLIKKIDKYFPEMIVDEVEGFRKSNSNNDISLKNIQQQMIAILMKHLDTTNTYKIKSGLFKIEDSVSFNKTKGINDSITISNSFTNSEVKSLYNDIIFINSKFVYDHKSNFLSKKFYQHELKNNEYLDKTLYHKIFFRPKKSSVKYSGFIYINTEDYSIKKVSYTYAENKKGGHFNLKWLLGVKFSENINNGNIYFEKTNNNKIYASYLNEFTQKYAYVNRPIKFIENSERKNKIKLNFKIELDIEEKKEIIINKTKNLSKDSLKIVDVNQNKKRSKFITTQEYEKSKWKNRFYFKQYLKKYE